MSTNAELSKCFDRMAAVLELLSRNRFKVAAYQRGARVLKDLNQDVAQLTDDIDQLTAIDGIGEGLAEKIIEYVQTGKIEEIDEALADVPDGVLALLDIPGLGPKTASMLWKQGGIESISDLKTKIESGELENLPRMGKKTLAKIGKSIAFAELAGDRARIGEAMPIAEHIVAELRRLKTVTRADYAGSLRRGRETIGDVDVLAACKAPEKDGEAIGEAFRSLPIVEEVIAAGPTKSSVRLEGGLQADLRVIRADRYGAALLYFTGSKPHNITLRERSIKQKLRLNEYGLWDAADFDKTSKDDPGVKPVAAKTEASIYKALGLAYTPPEMREDRGEIDAAQRDALQNLIELADIKAELHAHTVASDGVWTIEELAAAAKERGYHTVAVTDHSVSSVLPNGLNAKRLEKHIEAIHEANQKTKGITILAGSEVDILADGRLDYPDSLLAELDVVVASPHASLSQEPDIATRRLLRAIENPYVHIIGHPTGRLVNRREGIHPDIRQLIQAAAQTGTALEINANYYRLDLRDTHAKEAIEAGVMLAINTDAHGPGDFDQLPYGILTARRAWAQAANVVNCMTAAKLKSWLQAKRKKIGA